MKKIIAILFAVIMCVPLIYGVASKHIAQKKDDEMFVIVDITMDNYMDYIDFVATDTAIDIDGNPIGHTCVVMASKVYDDGLYFISSEDCKLGYRHISEINGTDSWHKPGEILEDISSPNHIKIVNIQGKYKFVKSEYVDEYIFENGVRKITLKDGRYQEIVFEGVSAVDFSHPY